MLVLFALPECSGWVVWFILILLCWGAHSGWFGDQEGVLHAHPEHLGGHQETLGGVTVGTVASLDSTMGH